MRSKFHIHKTELDFSCYLLARTIQGVTFVVYTVQSNEPGINTIPLYAMHQLNPNCCEVKVEQRLKEPFKNTNPRLTESKNKLIEFVRINSKHFREKCR